MLQEEGQKVHCRMQWCCNLTYEVLLIYTIRSLSFTKTLYTTLQHTTRYCIVGATGCLSHPFSSISHSPSYCGQLFRHDSVYHSRFKLSKAYLWQYPNIWRWMGMCACMCLCLLLHAYFCFKSTEYPALCATNNIL